GKDVDRAVASDTKCPKCSLFQYFEHLELRASLVGRPRAASSRNPARNQPTHALGASPTPRAATTTNHRKLPRTALLVVGIRPQRHRHPLQIILALDQHQHRLAVL